MRLLLSCKYHLTPYASCVEVEQTGASSQFYDKFSRCRFHDADFFSSFSFQMQGRSIPMSHPLFLTDSFAQAKHIIHFESCLEQSDP